MNKAKKTVKTPKVVPASRQKQPYIICIGASAGGLNALIELTSQLPARLNAAVLIVLHLSKAALGDILAEKIRRSTALKCTIAKDKEKVKPGHIYLSPPDVHLLVKEDAIVIGYGPPENRFRPSIDVLFRSVAAHYGERAIGVILTGMLNDGVSGMTAIRQSGGYCIIQNPNEAEYPDMPLAVLETVEVDHSVSLKKMGAVISSIAKGRKLKGIIPPPAIIAESKISEEMATNIENVSNLGDKTVFACPDCGGGLWKVGENNGHGMHYRCHVGHSYSDKDLITRQSETIEATLWVAVRMMEERKQLLYKLAREHNQKGLAQLSTSYKHQADHLAVHVEKMKELLFSIQKD